MERVRGLFNIALVVAFLAAMPATFISQTIPPAGNPLAEKTWSGQLVKVDTSVRLITVKGSDQKEMKFSYNDDTKVISPDKTIQSLADKPGAQLRIGYREERGVIWATRIELLESK